MHAGRRLLMAVVGAATLLVYLLAAFVGYQLLLTLWDARPSPVVAGATIVVVALFLGIVSYWAGTTQLRRSLDAVEFPYARAPDVYHRLSALSERMNVAMPTLLVARLPTPNAFAVGGSSAAIVVDRRLFGFLTMDELEALFAHELAHLENRDALVQTLAYSVIQNLVGLVVFALLPLIVLAGGIARGLALLRGRPDQWTESWLARGQRHTLQLVGLLGFAVTLLVLAYSRRREWAADDRAASVTGNPLALARALEKIDRASKPGMGLLSLLYVTGEEESTLSRLLSTHPPMDERIGRLRQRAQNEQQTDQQRYYLRGK